MKAYIRNREPEKKIIGYMSPNGQQIWFKALSGNAVYFSKDNPPYETTGQFTDLADKDHLQPIYEGDEILIQF